MQAETWAPILPGTHVKLREGVTRVSRAAGHHLIVSEDGAPLRVSASVETLWPLLANGASLARLVGEMQARYPKARDVEPKVRALVAQLGAKHLLEGTDAVEGKKGKTLTLPIDPLAAKLAAPFRAMPPLLLRTLVELAIVGAALGYVAMLRVRQPHFLDLVSSSSPLGLIVTLVITIPIHELGHAVACRLVGVPVARAGIEFSAFGLPRAFVKTPGVSLLARPFQRFIVPAGGPLSDLLFGGAFAWAAALLSPAGFVGRMASFVSLVLVLILVLGTNPLRSNDGSRMLEALLDDDLARRAALGRRARFSTPGRIRKYRAACVVHATASLALLWFLLR